MVDPRILDSDEASAASGDARVHPSPVILIGADLNVRTAASALQEGVFCVLEEPCRKDELAHALQDALEWEPMFREQSLGKTEIENRLQSLNARERCVLELILTGQPNKTIGRRLRVSQRTVERIRSAILNKMGTLSFVELSATIAAARTGGDNNSRRPKNEARRLSPAIPAADRTRAALRESTAQYERDGRFLRYDLHDGAAQYVSAAMLRLQSLDAQPGISTEGKSLLRESMMLLSRTLRDIRDIIAARPLECSRQPGLIPSLRSLVRELVGTSDIEVEFVGNLDSSGLDSLLQTAIHRFLQECLNNAVRHSGSKRVRVEVAERSGMIRLEVRDWGAGFDPSVIGVDHRGLRGIRERAELLGGKASIQTQPGWGTLVAVEVPLR